MFKFLFRPFSEPEAEYKVIKHKGVMVPLTLDLKYINVETLMTMNDLKIARWKTTRGRKFLENMSLLGFKPYILKYYDHGETYEMLLRNELLEWILQDLIPSEILKELSFKILSMIKYNIGHSKTGEVRNKNLILRDMQQRCILSKNILDKHMRNVDKIQNSQDQNMEKEMFEQIEKIYSRNLSLDLVRLMLSTVNEYEDD